MDGARGVLLSIAGGSDLGLFEINDAAQLVTDAAHSDANIIFGAVIDDALGDEVRVTVIAAGFDGGAPAYRPADAQRRSQFSSSTTTRPPTVTRQPPVQPPRRVLFDDVDVPDFLRTAPDARRLRGRPSSARRAELAANLRHRARSDRRRRAAAAGRDPVR